MKTVLVELLAFLLICLFGTAAGGLLITLYNGVSDFVVGSSPSLFSLNAFVNGAIVFFPILLLFVPMFLYLTLVRHPKYNKIFGAPAAALFSLSAWIFLAPLSFKAAERRNVFYKANPQELSAGYFRNINGRVSYFTFISGNYASGIRIDGSYFSGGNQRGSIQFLDSNFINFKRDALGFADPIAGENLRPPRILLNFLDAVKALYQAALAASLSGTAEWLFFSSIMAALASIGAVISASEWRLADAFYITFDTFAILTLNGLCALGHFEPAKEALAAAGSVFVLAANRFQFALNCAAALALAFLGTFKAIVHAAKKRGTE